MDKDFDELIISIYDAAADPLLWPDVLDRCARISGARSCAIFAYEPGDAPRPFTISQMCGSYPAESMDRYVHDNLEQEIADRTIAKTVISGLDRIEALSDEQVYVDYDEFLQRENVKYLMSLGLRHRVIAFLNKDNLNTTQFTLQYPDGRGPASSQELSNLNRVLPHLAKALDLGRPAMQLAADKLGLLGAIDRLNIGICILDRSGRIIQFNEEFRRQLEIPGTYQTSANGTLRFNLPDDQRVFEELKSHVRCHGKFGARPRKEVIAKQEDGYLCIELIKLDSLSEYGSGRFGGYVLYSIDTSKPLNVDPSPIKQAYNLTDAETKLVTEIAEGRTNAEIAELNNKAVNTVNNQVKAILAKTHCATRTQFVRLLMNFGTSYLS